MTNINLERAPTAPRTRSKWWWLVWLIVAGFILLAALEMLSASNAEADREQASGTDQAVEGASLDIRTRDESGVHHPEV